MKLPLKSTFRVSAGSADFRKNYFITIDYEVFGEAAGSVFYGPNEEQIRADLETAGLFLKDSNIRTPAVLDELADLEINTVSRAAVSGLIVNYLSKVNSVFPWRLFGLDEPSRLITSYTISLDDPAKMYDRIVASPYPVIKIKLGSDNDEELIKALAMIMGKVFRIDANGGWDPEKAERMIYLLNNLDIQLIEQPTDIKSIHDWKYIKGHSKIPLILDEGLNTLDDYIRYGDHIDGVNIKMAKSGGITEGIKIARRARRDKLKVMLGCMVESSVALSQAVYMASLADYYDFDGPILLEEMIAGGIDFNLEKVSVDEDIIGGPKIKKEFLNARMD